jgi:protein arginine kinase activator
MRLAAAEKQNLAAPPQSRLLELLADPSFNTRTAAPCLGCGLTYDAFRAAGLLGCLACYDTFEAALAAVLKALHGSEAHTGKRPEPKLAYPVSSARAPTWPSTPTRPTNKAEELADLEGRLKRAVDSEDFASAARLRDEIKRFKAGL